jgi:cytoskeleton protein RodZ
MQTVGSVLRAERLKQGLTLELVSAETKLPLRSLNAIEKDEIGAFSSPFFYKSFAKQYASRIRVDWGGIAALVEAKASEIPAPPLPGENEHLPDVPAINPPDSSAQSRWMFPSVALVAVMVGCSGVYAWWEGPHATRGVDAPAAVAAKPTPTAAQITPPRSTVPINTSAPLDATRPGNTGAVDAPSTDTPPSAPVAAPKAAPLVTPEASPSAAASEVQLKLSALERVWVSVVADGKSMFNGVLEVRDTKVFESKATAKIRVGNAGGLEVEYNGRSIGALGSRGQVLTAVFTPQTYEILNSQASPLAPHVDLTKDPIGE